MLGWFATDFFAKSPVLGAPLLALGIFFTVYVTISLRTFLTKKERFDYLANLPLEADDE